MDRPVVLSHRTARLFYHAPLRHSVLSSNRDYGISELGISSREVASRIQRFLADCGIPNEHLSEIDVIVAMDFMRIDSSVFCPHSFGSLLTERDVHELVPGLCVVCEELCFLQAASSLDALRLSELGYKLCGMYETSLSHDGSLGFTSRPPLTSRSSIQLYLEQHAGFKGVKKARKALARVRDHSRSPMETALAMMICLPRRLGGLGYRGIDMNVRIEIPEHLRTITTSNHLEVDIYAAQKHIGIEYDGEVHAPAQQRARDAERHTVLAALGIRTHVITRVQFSEQLALHRALNAVALDLNIPVDSSAAFQDAQNKLRLHFIREWKRANGSE